MLNWESLREWILHTRATSCASASPTAPCTSRRFWPRAEGLHHNRAAAAVADTSLKSFRGSPVPAVSSSGAVETAGNGASVQTVTTSLAPADPDDGVSASRRA